MNVFDKLTKNPYLKKKYFFAEGGGGAVGGGWGGGRLVNIHEQRFQMTLPLFKGNTCAKFF